VQLNLSPRAELIDNRSDICRFAMWQRSEVLGVRARSPDNSLPQFNLLQFCI
jgi:hypothetical protein